MKKYVLKNPRARRMLDLLDCPGKDNKPSTSSALTEDAVITEFIQPINPVDNETDKTLYNLRDTCRKNDVEGNQDSEDFSSDTSEYQPSPNRNVNSRSESTTSSLGDDFKCINQLIDSKMNSPASISNLSILLGNADFVASPTDIYKVDSTSTSVQTKNRLIEYQTCILNHSPIPSTSNTNKNDENIDDDTLKEDSSILLGNADFVASPTDIYKVDSTSTSVQTKNRSIEYQTCILSHSPIPSTSNTNKNDENMNDDTLKEDSETDSVVQNDILKRTSIVIEMNEIFEENKELSIIPYEIENKENNDYTHITLLSPVSPFIVETSTNDLQTEKQQNVTDMVAMLENNLITITQKNTATDTNTEKVLTSDNKKKTRKRCRNEQEWSDNQNKRLKNSGESYEGARSKKRYAAKNMGPSCSCRKNCGKAFSIERRQEIFDSFYRLKDHELQWQYIVRHVKAQPVKRITLERKNNRIQTIKYYFKQDQTNIQVCKVFFLNTLSISEQVVFTALEKLAQDESLIDKRGTHYNRPHRMSDDTKKSIMTHIELFPSVESHYTRKRSKRQYLSEHLNISKMYRLYTLWFPNQEYTQGQLASKRQYESVFNTQYNYTFFKPKKDLCISCSSYEQADEIKKSTLEEKYQQHLLRKTKVRQLKDEEKATADKNVTTIAIFDLEKVLNVPQSEVGIFHYKRKYPIYNFTIYNALNKSGHCYVWHLSIAKRGSIEIGSCLLKFINNERQRGIKNISFYSDGCAGQNKNRYIFALYLYAMKKGYLETITHRFFETGHSQNEGDSMHSLIERAMKNKVLYTPDQVYSVIMNAKITGDKYNLFEMEQTDFYNIKDLIAGKNWTTDTQGRKIAWTKIIEVKVSNSNPNILQFKYNYDDQYSELNTESLINRSRRGKRTAIVEETGFQLKQAYSEPIAVSKALLADLLSLCRIEAIPAHYHSFYNSLQSCDGNVEQPSDSDCDSNDGE